eukprot:scaffold89152_cov42-Cyclotella_meneghiniana.AAC.4
MATTHMNAMLRHVQYHHRLFLPPLYVAARSLSSAAVLPSSKKTKKDNYQHIVIALGGNALLKRGEPLTVSNQRKNISDGIAALSPILQQHKITLVHGNGPQVGLLALQGAAYQQQQQSSSSESEGMELDVLDAETEGMIGYLLEQEINHTLGDVAKQRGVVTVLSQIIVDPDDDAFDNPTKFIGPVYTKDAAMTLGKPVKPDGAQYYRRVVPSPMPVRLIDEQLTAVKLLANANVIVICAGGGGIPVIIQNNGRVTGIEAVIDKDRAACMMGKTLNAHGLMILTDVPGVAVHHGTRDERWIKSASPQQLTLLAKNHFPEGSMGPKVSSAVDFVQNYGGWSMIGSLKDSCRMMDNEAGTVVTNEFGPDHLEFY